MKKRIKSWWDGQWVSLDNVKPTQSYNNATGRMYFDSLAGHIEVRFKHRNLVAPFRDKYVNRFHDCKSKKDFFNLYEEIRNEKIKGVKIIYTANINTRLKGKVCNLLTLN